MVYQEQFWLDKYWSDFGKKTWRLFKTSVELLGVLGESDEASKFVNLAALLAKHIVEKLSKHVDVEEPEFSGSKDAYLVVDFMKEIADFAIGKNPTVTLTWLLRNVSFEFVRVNFNTVMEKPERFDYLIKILGFKEIYTPPEILTGREIDLTFYHAPGYLDNVEVKTGVEHVGKGKFKYIIELIDKPNFENNSLASLITRLGLLSWEILRSKPGILSIFETVDAKAQFLELAQTKIPSKSREIVESRSIHALGDGRVYHIAEERVTPEGSILIKLVSDQYNVGIPMPKACRDAVFEFKGAIINVYEVCLETDIVLRETKHSYSSEPVRKLNVIEYIRGIQPLVYLGLWDIVYINGKHMLIARA